ncbi:hypothetical protein [Cerasicoccus frondis]|uniref:hypothetical protein n=1 Tax=Cerasicoccus frondis TaxID=490090 RepID=UPI002852D686|nr:hypothetical protein [Cerasicoccus frondis]
MKRRKFNIPLLEVIIVSLIIHIAALFLLGGVAIWQNFRNAPLELEAPPIAEPMDQPTRVKIKPMLDMEPASVKKIQVRSITTMDIPMVDVDMPMVDNRVAMGGFSGNGIGKGISGVDLSKISVDFFGLSGNAERIAFVVDYSSSMTKMAGSIPRVELMRKEFTRSVNDLPEQAMVSVLFFAGPVWEPVGVENKELKAVVSDAKKTYKMPGQKGADAYALPEGVKPPTPKWRTLSSANKRIITQQIQNSPLTNGTTWSLPFEVVFAMEEPPDLIFFLTDGAVGKEDQEKTIEMVGRWHRKNPDAKINTIALGIPGAEESLKLIAEMTNGRYTLITDEVKHN